MRTEYFICECVSAVELASQVQQLCTFEGWELQGGVCIYFDPNSGISPFWYAQALVRKDWPRE